MRSFVVTVAVVVAGLGVALALPTPKTTTSVTVPEVTVTAPHAPPRGHPRPSAATLRSAIVGTVPAAGACHARARGARPDPTCTPGSVEDDRLIGPKVDLAATICRRGWTATVRPPESVTDPLKRKLLRAYGYRDQRAGDYELDHLIPLELGGAPAAVSNLWPERHPASYRKDGVENSLHAAVCAGRLPLVTAQTAIAQDWRKAKP